MFYAATQDMEDKRKRNKAMRIDWAKDYHNKITEKRQQRKDMLKNQIEYYKTATAKNKPFQLRQSSF